MKKLFINTTLLLLFSFAMVAQDIAIKESTVEHNDEMRPSWSVMISPDSKTVKKEWKDFMDDKYDLDVSGIGFLTNKDLLTSEKVVIDKITDRKIDFYAKVVEENDMTRIDVFAAPGYDIYINPDRMPNGFSAMRSVLIEFLNYYLPEYYQEKIEDAQGEFEDLVDTRDDLEGDIESNIDEIDDMKKEIEELKKENQSLGDDLFKTRKKLTEAEKELKLKEDEKRKIEQKIEEIKNINNE